MKYKTMPTNTLHFESFKKRTNPIKPVAIDDTYYDAKRTVCVRNRTFMKSQRNVVSAKKKKEFT